MIEAPTADSQRQLSASEVQDIDERILQHCAQNLGSDSPAGVLAQKAGGWQARGLRLGRELRPYLSIYLAMYSCFHIHLSTYVSVALSVYLSVCLSVYLSARMYTYIESHGDNFWQPPYLDSYHFPKQT